ncbi:methyltransferase domain-containing protein [Amycolatopsis rhabdoformis]|uniref:Methyltransferase domain-containing protein n=1 Tax=Amycolatopsis rhabdoformis TaxID=1448059 RepID=A0ABZ1IBR8_9PSEU|nr:methyltransferase domain-containing protein [Amycolatopsis rhabdoformis]WSE31921.1 methyltransferase domain-containing protein [Amycolatopsis rhabdoformis]
MTDLAWLRTQWDKYAPQYDRAIGALERLQFGGGRGWVCAQARGDVLEVAVGTGLNLAHYPPHVRLTGLDLSPAMLALARQRAETLGRPVTLQEGNAEALPFADASFDTVACTLGLCGFPDDRAAIAEMHRVLRPGGTLLLLDHIGSHHRALRWAQRLLERVTLRTIGDYQTRRPLPWVTAAGFEIVTAQRLKLGTVERLAARKPS